MKKILFICCALMLLISCREKKKVVQQAPEAARAQAPPEIRSNMPTVAAMPDFENKGDTSNMRLHEDEWRQIEFVAMKQRPLADSIMAIISDIYAHHAQSDGQYTTFSKIYERDLPPLADMNYGRLLSFFGLNGMQVKNITIYNHPGQVVGGFGFSTNGLSFYGIRQDDRVSVFCIRSAESEDALKQALPLLSRLMKQERLLLADWRKMKIFDSKNVKSLLGV